MDYPTARHFIIAQGTALQTRHNPDAFLALLDRGDRPIPGQMTSILLALKVIFAATQDSDSLDRELANGVYLLAIESRNCFEAGLRQGVKWPPLLAEDLDRLQAAANSIFSGTWQE